MINKEIIKYQGIHIIKYTKDISKPYLIFVHGVPGYNCAVVEYLIDNNQLFSCLDYNLFLYDQRSCARSEAKISVSH